ncbi:rCG38758 [Rattus norvegicus]|uniref:RCG38758 n=1 Tax=Rattus norvegicus TaxID=10116 RepID=A6K9K2_RAT|nr:rCG38758 [Rattus norvegicus]
MSLLSSTERCLFPFMYIFISLNPSSLWKSEESIGSPRTGDIDHCELKCGSWKLNVGSLEKKPVLLTSEPLIHICSGSVHIS